MFYSEINVGITCFLLRKILDRDSQCVIQSVMMLFESHPSQAEQVEVGHLDRVAHRQPFAVSPLAVSSYLWH